jgi:hypothetical protein
MKINEDVKIFHLLEDYPEVEEILKKHFKYFYDEELVDIALKRLSIQGACNVLNLPQEEKEKLIEELIEIISSLEEH